MIQIIEPCKVESHIKRFFVNKVKGIIYGVDPRYPDRQSTPSLRGVIVQVCYCIRKFCLFSFVESLYIGYGEWTYTSWKVPGPVLTLFKEGKLLPKDATM